jgi:hypothetical protein
MSAKDITATLREAMRKSFPPAEYAMFHEVANGTGGNARNYADVVAMSLWPSRGLQIIGFELKASRSDWLREKGKPEKSVAIQQYCDRWNLVTAKGVVLDSSEIPEAWGWLELVGQKLYTRKVAPKLESIECTRTFLAALLRRAGQVDEATISTRVSAALVDANARMTEQNEAMLERRLGDATAATNAIKEFEATSGIRIQLYDGGEIGAAFAAFQKLRAITSGWSGINRIAKNLADAAATAAEAHEQLTAICASQVKETA